LKQRLDFPDKKGFELWLDLLNVEAEKSLKQRLVFLTEKWIATMVRFPSNSS